MKRFGKRLVGLSECHDLLVQSKWASVDLEQMIRRNLDCYMIGRELRISINGPTLRLAETAAKPIGMALHELATNARKYGAFSGAIGGLSVSWRFAENNVEVLWKEQDGPPPMGSAIVAAKLFRPSDNRAVHGDLVVLDLLRRGDDGRVEHFFVFDL